MIANTGEARIYGFEWDVKGAVLPGLALSTSGSFNRAVILSTGLVLNQATNEPYRNVPVEGVPVWNAKIGANYVHPLSDDVNGFLRIDTTATGNSHGTFVAGTPDYDRPIYSLTTLSSGVDIGKDYTVSLFVKNLFDNRTVIQQPSVDYLNVRITEYTAHHRHHGKHRFLTPVYQDMRARGPKPGLLSIGHSPGVPTTAPAQPARRYPRP